MEQFEVLLSSLFVHCFIIKLSAISYQPWPLATLLEVRSAVSYQLTSLLPTSYSLLILNS
ncbi:MAG: hypothetical protein F6K38_39595 [Moorea sp. SIO3B2]|nr:hypothetical protein [Moorena sp. SIO3B2]